MMEMIAFAITFVVAQTVAGLIVMGIAMKFFMSKKTLKKYSKMVIELSNEIVEELDSEEEA